MKIRAASAEPQDMPYQNGDLASGYPVASRPVATEPPTIPSSSTPLVEGHPMNHRAVNPVPEDKALATNPLDESVLEDFYRPRGGRRRPAAAGEKPKPTHYKIVCISLYNEDIERLEGLVAELKRRGHTRANKSQLIRAALDQVDLSRIPKGY
jgi:hypothetical protein